MASGNNGSGDISESSSRGFDALVKRAQAGDRDAMGQVCERVSSYVLRLSRTYSSLARTVESPEDLAQQALMRICEKIGTFVGGSDDEATFKMFWCWSGSLTRNLCFNARRHGRQKRRYPGSIQSLDAMKPGGPPGSSGNDALHSKHTTPFTGARRAEIRQKILSAMDDLLDDREARVMHLIYFRGFSFIEVADALGLDCGDVRASWAEACQKLQPELEGLL